MMKLFLLALSINSIVYGSDPGSVSAYRDLSMDYRHYEEHALLRTSLKESFMTRTTPLSQATIYDESKLPEVTSWREKDLLTRFESLRDGRHLVMSGKPEMPRRPSWLYPDDGCFARAAMVNRQAFRSFYPTPNKVFAFGNLRVKTPHSKRGVVGWWYHVAAIVQVKDKKYVIDPSIELTRPLELQEWIKRMGNPQKIKVAICGSGTYSPGDSCDKKTDGIESRARRAQEHYLRLEWERVKALGLPPEDKLGNNPPWQKPL